MNQATAKSIVSCVTSTGVQGEGFSTGVQGAHPLHPRGVMFVRKYVYVFPRLLDYHAVEFHVSQMQSITQNALQHSGQASTLSASDIDASDCFRMYNRKHNRKKCLPRNESAL